MEKGSENLVKTRIGDSCGCFLILSYSKSFTSKLAKYIPGTNEYTQEQQQYMRKMRDVTAQRVAQFSNVFQALSNSFSSQDEIR